MKDFIYTCFLYGIVGGLMGTAWTQVIKPYMIFSSIGLWLRRVSHSFHGKTIFVLPCNPVNGCQRWDVKLPFFRKLAKGAACIYCASTWFTIFTYIIFPVELSFNITTIHYHFVGVVAAIGVNMCVAQIVVVLREIV
jgi:uncharacterized membrane protein (DUF485 family)